MAEEISMYNDANITITNLRAMLHGKTYAMANITSVSVYTHLVSKVPGIVVAVIGGLMILASLQAGELKGCIAFLGFLFLLIGAVHAYRARNKYWVRIGSASGETNALSSTDQTYIARVVHAMNEAIVKRG
jgi:hypothetical protein